MDENRGKIIHRERSRQINDFCGLRWGNITPTDIDGFVDFQDRIFVFIEVKYEDIELPRGQKLALERLCDACESSEKHSLVLVARHSIIDVNNDVDVSLLLVDEYRTMGKWQKPLKQITVKEAIDKFIKWQPPKI